METLSQRYQVRSLTEADTEAIYDLSIGNPLFFEYCPPFVTRQSIQEDLKALPPNVTYADKHYVGFFDGEKLAAILDLITHYPNPATAFLGLFMVAREYQGKGTGSGILQDCIAALRSAGYARIRLAFAKGNPQSEAFWLKNGFRRTGEEYVREGYTAVVMEREIIRFQEAKPEEAEILSELRHRAWETTYRGIFPDEMIDQFDFTWHTMRDLWRIESDRFEVYFLVAGGQKIGYLILQKGEPFHLQSLYLLKEYRGRGCGTQVFSFVRRHCREHGISNFYLDCHPDNHGAIKFYTKMGGTIIRQDMGHERNEENGVTFAFDV